MANDPTSLEALEAAFLLIQDNYDDLRQAARTKAERDALRRHRETAKKEYEKAVAARFDEANEVITTTKQALDTTTKALKEELAGMKRTAEMLRLFASVVGLITALVALG